MRLRRNKYLKQVFYATMMVLTIILVLNTTSKMFDACSTGVANISAQVEQINSNSNCVRAIVDIPRGVAVPKEQIVIDSLCPHRDHTGLIVRGSTQNSYYIECMCP